MWILSPISNPSKLNSKLSGISFTGQITSTVYLTTFKTPPLLRPGLNISLVNLTGTSIVTLVLSFTLKKSMCSKRSVTGFCDIP